VKSLKGTAQAAVVKSTGQYDREQRFFLSLVNRPPRTADGQTDWPSQQLVEHWDE